MKGTDTKDLSYTAAVGRVYDVRNSFDEIRGSYFRLGWCRYEKAFAGLFEPRIEHLEEIAAVCAPAHLVLAHALALENDLAVEYKILSARNRRQRFKSFFFGKAPQNPNVNHPG